MRELATGLRRHFWCICGVLAIGTRAWRVGLVKCCSFVAARAALACLSLPEPIRVEFTPSATPIQATLYRRTIFQFSMKSLTAMSELCSSSQSHAEPPAILFLLSHQSDYNCIWLSAVLGYQSALSPDCSAGFNSIAFPQKALLCCFSTSRNDLSAVYCGTRNCCKIINEILKRPAFQSVSQLSSVIILIALCTIAIYIAINFFSLSAAHFLMEQNLFLVQLHGCLIDIVYKCDWQLSSGDELGLSVGATTRAVQ